jgi:hypothetical protein
VDATFVGRPLAELPHPAISRDTFAAQRKLTPQMLDCAYARQPREGSPHEPADHPRCGCATRPSL